MPHRKRDHVLLLLAGVGSLALAPVTAQAGLFGSRPTAAKAAPSAKQPAEAVATKADPATRAAADRLDPIGRAAFWLRETQVDPTDMVAAVKLSGSLRALGRFDEANAATEKALVMQPGDVDALLEAARARIGADQGFYAVEYLQRARAIAPRDWRVPSLLGVAYGQTKRLAEAKAAYAEALRLSPENPAVLSNMALTLAAAGEAAQAEPLLRRAAASPVAGSTERQNLALVLGLEGKMGEAESLIRRDLPPDAADSNLAYLQAANSRR